MLHVAFNFSAPQVSLRLSGLIICAAIIICLGILELRPRLPGRIRVAIVLFTFVLAICAGYLVVKLKGA